MKYPVMHIHYFWIILIYLPGQLVKSLLGVWQYQWYLISQSISNIQFPFLYKNVKCMYIQYIGYILITSYNLYKLVYIFIKISQISFLSNKIIDISIDGKQGLSESPVHINT